MKGIILAGGLGTRLYPLTLSLSKQLLPVYDKPMIYYSLSVFMIAGIKDILIITNPEYLKLYQNLLGNGSDLGISLSYKIQEKPSGLPEAFLIGEDFIGEDSCSLILGDNIFYSASLSTLLKESTSLREGAINFAFHVKNPKDYGVVEFDKEGSILSLEEKPLLPKSNYALTGLYFYDNTVIEKVKTLKPSARGETEIIELNSLYLKENKLAVKILGRGASWFDAGSHDSLLEASQFIQSIENRQGFKIACLEEIAFSQGWINKNQLEKLAQKYNNDYGFYLRNLLG